jgi:Leucine-rich repeat (LRR) protein
MLEELNLSNGSIIDPPFLNTRVIRKLNLSYNRISLLWDECMPRGIVELDLQENYISSDGLLVDWPNSIEVLNLSKNQFTTLEHTLHWPNALRELNVSDTQLEEIYAEELPSTLEVLLLNKTNIRAIFYLPPALKRIEAYSSMLNLLPPVMPPTLEIVDFSNLYRGGTSSRC